MRTPMEEEKSNPQRAKIEYAVAGRINEIMFETVIVDGTPRFAVWDGKEIKISSGIRKNEARLVRPPLLSAELSDIMSFPSGVEPFGSERELLEDVCSFIHAYAELKPFYERLLGYYVLLTWCFEELKSVPYIQIIADIGSGKTRVGEIMRELCYHGCMFTPMSTVAPLLRLAHRYKATFIIDEAQFLNDRKAPRTDEYLDILYQGYHSSGRVLRAMEKNRDRDPSGFNVFGPKIMLSRERMNDEAIESRSLKIDLHERTRKDIPLNLDDAFYENARAFSRRLLDWRFRLWGTRRLRLDATEEDESIRSRWSQLLQILFCLVEDSGDRARMKEYIKELAIEAIENRSSGLDAEIVKQLVILNTETVTLSELRDFVNQGKSSKEETSSQRIGYYLNTKLGIKTNRHSRLKITSINRRDQWPRIIGWAKNLGIDIPENPLFAPDAETQTIMPLSVSEAKGLAILTGEQTALPVAVEKSEEDNSIPF